MSCLVSRHLTKQNKPSFFPEKFQDQYFLSAKTEGPIQLEENLLEDTRSTYIRLTHFLCSIISQKRENVPRCCDLTSNDANVPEVFLSFLFFFAKEHSRSVLQWDSKSSKTLLKSEYFRATEKGLLWVTSNLCRKQDIYIYIFFLRVLCHKSN